MGIGEVDNNIDVAVEGVSEGMEGSGLAGADLECETQLVGWARARLAGDGELASLLGRDRKALERAIGKVRSAA